ncbi:MAG: glutaredoxin domain-containing protein [Candidatus Dormibacteria bacterium]
MAEIVTVFVRPGDPSCERALAYLRERSIQFQIVDITAEPQAAQLLLSRVGQVVVPTFVVGDKLVVGFDPVQLARYLPRQEEPAAEPETEPAVNFGAAVRSVSPEVARAHGLPYAYGAEVGPVKQESPAATAGIATGDLITEIGAYTLTGGADQFRTAVAGRLPGDTMTLTTMHDGESRVVEVHFPQPDATPAVAEEFTEVETGPGAAAKPGTVSG